MNQRLSWVADLLDSDKKAMGTYLALIYLRVCKANHVYSAKPVGKLEMNDRNAKKLISRYFSKTDEAELASETGAEFIDRLFRIEGVLNYSNRNLILDEIEKEFLDKFVSAFEKYLRIEQIPEKSRDKIAEILLDIRNGLYGKPSTPAGTVSILRSDLVERAKKFRGISEEEILELILPSLMSSGLMLERLIPDPSPYYTFPAPCLSEEIIALTKLGGREGVTKPEIVRPANKIDDIFSTALKELGFEVSLSTSKESRQGEPVKVDVWGQRRIGSTRFSVYVSCRNWNKTVNKDGVIEEISRVVNLRELPQLRIIVARELTKDAREIAESEGFYIIELGRRTDAKEISELVNKALEDFFTSIAHPKLRELTSRIADLEEKLEKIEKDLSELISKLKKT